MRAFSLNDSTGKTFAFPTQRYDLLAFVNEECPTCNLVMPLIDAAFRAFNRGLDVWAIGQDAAGNAELIKNHQLGVPMLDDSSLKVSYGFDIEIVPTIVLTDPQGREVKRVVGFNKAEWQELFDAVVTVSRVESPNLDWSQYPANRPGCGSASVLPGVEERLSLEAAGTRLCARRIDIGDLEDVFEFMSDHGFTDGLPVVPPTVERVVKMLSGTRRDPGEMAATIPPNMAPCTVEKVAINSVMAGCKPEYMPVVLAALEATCDTAFNVHGVMATTAGGTPVIVVNGPIRHWLGMNMKLGALGPGNRANASIGRALKLILRNVGGFRPGGVERSTLGSPNKFTACFPEWEERSPFEPLHVERGFQREDSVVTVYGMVSGCFQLNDHSARTAQALGTTLAETLRVIGTPKSYNLNESLLVLSPEHADTLRRTGWTKADLRDYIQQATARKIRDLIPQDRNSEGLSWEGLEIGNPTIEALERTISKFAEPNNLQIVVAGGEAGKFSAIFKGWGGVWHSVSRIIDPTQ
ncbi:MAG TPA: hypothetical protein VGY99_22555 [Candidatus Binataceae bacterium]|jgi:hypothetical protein|nr:hypothetical protein [Candidatus Binataceae bacterium]